MKTTTCTAIFRHSSKAYDYYIDTALEPKAGDLAIVPSGFSDFGYAVVLITSVDAQQRELNVAYEYKTITQLVDKGA